MAGPRLRRPRPYKVTHTVTAPEGTALRYKAVVVDGKGRTASALAETVAGRAPAEPVPTATQRDYALVHYKRADGDYTDWRLYAWGDIADGEGTTGRTATPSRAATPTAPLPGSS